MIVNFTKENLPGLPDSVALDNDGLLYITATRAQQVSAK